MRTSPAVSLRTVPHAERNPGRTSVPSIVSIDDRAFSGSLRAFDAAGPSCSQRRSMIRTGATSCGDRRHLEAEDRLVHLA